MARAKSAGCRRICGVLAYMVALKLSRTPTVSAIPRHSGGNACDVRGNSEITPELICSWS